MHGVDDLVEQYVANKISRRQFTKAAVALGVSMPGISAFLAACATTTSSGAPGASAAPGQSAAASLGAPASVDKLTVAVDSWGTDDLNPVNMVGDNFLQDYFNLILLGLDENNKPVSHLATEWTVADDGYTFTLDPKATWEDGTPITADDIKWCIEAEAGHVEGYTGDTGAAELANIDRIDILSPNKLFIHLSAPSPAMFSVLSGAGYHDFHFTARHFIEPGGLAAYNAAPKGGGPYIVKEWHPGDRIVLERREDFWADNAYLHKPQHKTLEIIRSPDDAARYALLASGQADIVVNVPYSVAKDLTPSSPRGINPGLGATWTQQIQGSGNMMIEFPNQFAVLDSADKPTPDQLKPFDDPNVRLALELAIDKKAISEKALYGFTTPMASLYFIGSVGYQEGRLQVSPYDPEKAKSLLAAAGVTSLQADVYYGPFPNSPGIKEWLEAAASYWQAVGVQVNLKEVVAAEYYKRFGFGAKFGDRERAWRPMAVQTWGRQNDGTVLADFGYKKDGAYSCCYDDESTSMVAEIDNTMDDTARAALLQKLEDKVLSEHWMIPMQEVSIVVGYSDRVLSHPTAPYGASFEQLWRVVLRS